MMRSPKLLRDVSALAKPAISAERLASSLVVVPERNSDVVSVSITALDPEVAINVANLFATEAVQFSKNMQIEEAKAANVYYTNQLAEMDRDRKVLIAEMQETARDAARSAIHPSQLTDKFQVALAEKVQAAREELVNLLAKYTDAHPSVKEQKSKIEALQKQLKEMATNNIANSEQELAVTFPTGRQSSTNAMRSTGRESKPPARGRGPSPDHNRRPHHRGTRWTPTW